MISVPAKSCVLFMRIVSREIESLVDNHKSMMG